MQRRPVQIEIGAEHSVAPQRGQLRAAEIDEGVEDRQRGLVLLGDAARHVEQREKVLAHQRGESLRDVLDEVALDLAHLERGARHAGDALVHRGAKHRLRRKVVLHQSGGHPRGGGDVTDRGRLDPISGEALQRDLPDALVAGCVRRRVGRYLIHRLRDIPRVTLEGLRLRRRWPQTEGALGLWVAAFRGGRRQVSISIWRAPGDLRLFVRSPEHRRIMDEFRDAGALLTSTWTAERFDPALIWQQGIDRLRGGVEGVRHHQRRKA